jgi:hypothetical protein
VFTERYAMSSYKKQICIFCKEAIYCKKALKIIAAEKTKNSWRFGDLCGEKFRSTNESTMGDPENIFTRKLP